MADIVSIATAHYDQSLGMWEHTDNKGRAFGDARKELTQADLDETTEMVDLYDAQDLDALEDRMADIAGEEEYDRQQSVYESMAW